MSNEQWVKFENNINYAAAPMMLALFLSQRQTMELLKNRHYEYLN
jgi:hypothetical protein